MDRVCSIVTVRSVQGCPGHGGVVHFAPDQSRATGFNIHPGRQGAALFAFVTLKGRQLGVRASTGDSDGA